MDSNKSLTPRSVAGRSLYSEVRPNVTNTNADGFGLYYNPTITMEGQPGLIDWIEDFMFTGLLFVAVTLLIYDVTGHALA